jgi:hypothetical protein
MIVGRASVAAGSVTILPPTAHAAAAAIRPVVVALEAPSTVSVSWTVIPGERRHLELDPATFGWVVFAGVRWDAYDHLAPIAGPINAMILRPRDRRRRRANSPRRPKRLRRASGAKTTGRPPVQLTTG